MPEETCLAKGRFERIGQQDGIWTHGDRSEILALPNYNSAIERMVSVIDVPDGPIGGLQHLDAVGFKTVAAKGIEGCVELTEDVLQRMEDYTLLAPAHNPPYIQAIRAFAQLLPHTKRIGLFEPAFHHTMPEYARTYPLPERWREIHAIRRYGYHGASHRYIAERLPQLMNRDGSSLRLISCHLGGSSSLCAIKNGKSIDTSMGFSPQSGIFHATRHGELDPFAVLYVMQRDRLTIDELIPELTKKSGLAGISGIPTGDMREIEEAMLQGDARATLAFQALCYTIKKEIGAFMVALGGVDGIGFAGGIGERSPAVRAEVCRGLEAFGIQLDVGANQDANGKEVRISPPEATVQIWVVPTNEELIVARACHEYIIAE